MPAHAIIVAGGSGLRMNTPIRKQYLPLAGRPVLCHTLSRFSACDAVDGIYLVTPEADFDFCRREVLAPLHLRFPVYLVAGGAERQDSVYNGLCAAGETAKNGLVAIHDGVRPFVTAEEIGTCIAEAERTGACLLGIPAADTLKQVRSGRVETTLDRSRIWLAQTPQTFRYDLIRQAHENARKAGISGTDDAALVEYLGHPVTMLPGSRFNIKLTTPEDLRLAAALMDLSGGKGRF